MRPCPLRVGKEERIINSSQTALSAVLPMFIMLSLGYFLRETSVVDDHTLNRINKLCLKIFLVISLYYNIYKMDIREIFSRKLIVYAVIAQIVILRISLLTAYPTEKTRKRRDALTYGVSYTNFVILGALIGAALCGEGSIGAISLLVVVIVPVRNIIFVILLELFREGRGVKLRKVFGGVVTNPYVITALTGFLTQLLRIQYPDVLSNAFKDLGRCGTPVALIIMGGLFSFGAVKSNLRSIAVSILFKLLAMPAILVPITVWLGFYKADFIGLICISIVPCAITSFNPASAADFDADLTAQLVVFTSVCSLGTIFMWIFILSRMGIF